jgi:hypothetical protein
MRHGNMEKWRRRDMDMETWRYGHGNMDMVTWRRGDMDMETWSWRHGHGDMENANKLYDMCGYVGFRGGIWRKGGANGLWESGQWSGGKLAPLH